MQTLEKCETLEIYQLDPTKYLSNTAIAWQATLNNTKVELKLSTDTDMLLKVEKEITGGICHYINKYAKANNKYMKGYDKNNESSNLKYWN